MKKTFIKLITSSTIILLLLTSFTGCVEPIEDPILPERGFFIGLLPVPSDGQELEETYQKVAQYTEFVPIWSSGTGAAGFWEYADKLDGWWGTTFLEGFIRGNNMFPIIHFSFIDKNEQGNLILKTPTNLPDATLQTPEWRGLYKKAILDVVEVAKPAYISLGNEVNRWYEAYGAEESDPNGFQHFVSLYEETYEAVKKISPETNIFCVFSREIVSENREANLDVLSMFQLNTIDILMFTTYPYALPSINKPSDIPSDYYLQASAYMPGKLFGFSEIGWSSLESFGGEQGQYDFLINLSSSLTVDQGINLHFFGYCWLTDLEGGDTTGLIQRDGTEKLGYQAWKEISDSNLWKKQPNDTLVFMSKADSEEGELYLLNKEGEIKRLTNNNRHENNPALSFDKTKIAFHAGESDNPLTWEIYTIDLETNKETQITNNGVLDGHPDWSPDGTKIVYASFQDLDGNPAGVADIFVCNTDGSSNQRLTTSTWEDNDPEWSPDGTKIVFKSTRNTQQDAREEIYIMDSNGHNITRLTTTEGYESDHDPSWSPNSDFIVYTHYSGMRPWTDIANLNDLINNWEELIPWNVYKVDLDGNFQQLTHSEQIAHLPVYSSKGDTLLFIDYEFILSNTNKLRGIHHRLTLIDTDGTNNRQLLSDDEHTPTLEYFDW